MRPKVNLMNKSKEELINMIRGYKGNLVRIRNNNDRLRDQIRSYKHHIKATAKRLNFLAEHTYISTLKMKGTQKRV